MAKATLSDNILALQDVSCEILNSTEQLRRLTSPNDGDAIAVVNALEKANSVFAAWLWKLTNKTEEV